MASLYADENFPFPVVARLRALGHDVLTTLDDGRAGQKIPDPQVLARATQLGRAVLTHNRKDYHRLHRLDPNHAGIVSCRVASSVRICSVTLARIVRKSSCASTCA